MAQPLSFSVCVFCGSRSGQNPAYVAAAEALGAGIAAESWRLVYGAGDIGIMGATARAAQKSGAHAFGVIPTHLMEMEKGKRDLDTFIITENMHERKKVMFMNSNAIVVLPGGAGTLDEFFEILTWAQIKLHKKPIYLLNTAGFWDPLLALLKHVVAEGFAEASLLDLFEVHDEVEPLLEALRARCS